MVWKRIYKGKADSPITYSTTTLTVDGTSVTLADSSIPSTGEVGGYLVFSTGTVTEVMEYITNPVDGVYTGLVRAVDGRTPMEWPIGSIVSREYTSQDQQDIIDAAEELQDAIDAIPDVIVTNLTTGHVPRYNGTFWVNSDALITLENTYNGLPDITLTSLTAGQVPKYNGTFWVNATLTPAEVGAAAVTHATTHKTGGVDAIKLDELAAPTDVTTLNVTTSAHGLMKKLPGVTTTFFRGDGAFAAVDSVALGDGKSVKLVEALGTDQTVSGITVTLTAAAAVTIGQVCYINSSGQAALTDADAIATMPVRVMATASIAAGASGVFLLSGYMRNDSLTFTPGATLYASGTAGAITHTPPSGTSGVVQSVGYAITAHIMYFNPGTYVELV